MQITIKTRPTKRQGLAFDLYYRWNGKRYRPLLGYNLTKQETEQRALELIAKIQTGGQVKAQPKPLSPTLREFLPVYWQTMRTFSGGMPRSRAVSVRQFAMPPVGV